MIGINSRGQGRGIGFTIPIDTAREVMAQLEHGGIERGFLGVTFQALDRELADYFGVPRRDRRGGEQRGAGLAGRRAPACCPATSSRASTASPVEAEEEEDLGTSSAWSQRCRPASTVRIELLRGGRAARASQIVLGAQPKLDAAEVESELGFHVQEITPSSRASIGSTSTAAPS